MKQLTAVLSVPSLAIVLLGCELETQEPDPPQTTRADHLVINEVFTLPADHQAAYSWIEFYNPTGDTIDLTNWTLTYTTFRLNTTVTVGVDTFGNIFPFQFVTVVDSIGLFDVPFAGGVLDIPGVEEDTVEILPNNLYTIVSDEDRFLDHTNWGSGDQRFRDEKPVIEGPIDGFSVIDSTDTLITLQVTFKSYAFLLPMTEQLLLKDPSGNVVDVVRYGNYVYGGPDTNDPYPNNTSMGFLPEFQSIQRYAGAYDTDNTANDFYESTFEIVPTPNWFNSVCKGCFGN